MKRQLYEGGGIMSLSKEGIGGGSIKGVDMGSRIGFFNPFKEAKKIVKKTTKAVKKIVSSDIGKAALLAAAGAYAGGLGPFSATGSLGGIRGAGFARGLFPSIMDYSTPTRSFFTEVGKLGSKALGKVAGDGITGMLGKGAALAGVTAFLTSKYGMTEEQAEEELTRDPSTYLRMYYTNLNPNAGSEEIEEFVRQNSADGGRIGFAEGPVLPPDPTQPVNPFGPKPGDFGIEEDIPIKMASNIENDKILEALFEKYIDMGLSPIEAEKAAYAEFERMSKNQERFFDPKDRGLAALGGRMGFDKGTPKEGIVSMIEENMQIPMEEGERTPSILDEFDQIKKFKIFDDDMVVIIRVDEDGNRKLIPVPRSQVMPDAQVPRSMKAKGDSASMNAMQAAGVEGLPIRQNPKGVRELDLRETGGFIPPVGIKEKADDIPAMLSNNEFVMTADAVRGMGGGDVNLGAQRMYDQMKMLEAGGKV